MEEIKVTFIPDNIEVYEKKGTPISEVARKAGLNIYKPCGGDGTCGKCKVQIQNLESKPNRNELKHLGKEELVNNVRLACQSLIKDDMIIKILRYNDSEKTQILTNKENFKNITIDPYIKSKKIKINIKDSQWKAKSLSDSVIKLCGDNFKMNLDAIKDLSEIYNPYNKELLITVLYTNEEIISVSKGEMEYKYSVGIDIGTTSVVANLINVRDGKQIAVSSKLNPQVEFGDDVIARINYSNQNSNGVEELNKAIIKTINEQIEELCEEGNIEKEEILEISINANTIMQHFFLNINPKSIGLSPYLPSFLTEDRIKAKQIGLNINKAGLVTVLPNISGYVGSDVLSGAYMVDISKDENIKVVIDIGTNNEIILGNKNFIFACASAAGPAFEGARISSGMRATSGAIEHIKYHGEEVEIGVIGNIHPIGICGSGIIDLMSELLALKVVDSSGKMIRQEGNIQRVELDSNNTNIFRVTDFEHEENLYLTQKDVREIQLAKGAVLAGLNIMLKEADISIKDVDKIYLAGAFGNYINIKNAINIGLLPDIDADKVELIGNSSAMVSSIATLSKDVLDEMRLLAEKTQYIELSTHPDFQREFLNAILFP